jgi:hypothetical protein
MAVRLTEKQKRLMAGMQCLIDIHGLQFSEISDTDQWPWEKISNLLKKFCDEVFDSNRSSYDRQLKKIFFRSGKSKMITGSTVFDESQNSPWQKIIVGTEEILHTVSLVDDLGNAIRNKEIIGFEIHAKEHTIETLINRDQTEITKDNPKGNDATSSESEGSDQINDGGKILKKMDKLSLKAMEHGRFQKIKIEGYLITSQPMIRYSILLSQNQSISKFTKKLLWTDLDITDGYMTMMSLEHDSWLSWHQLLKSFFVEYYFCLGDFSKIKMCHYESCGKLMLEYRTNQKDFCSHACKSKSFKLDLRNKCRVNQNKWIDDVDSKFSGGRRKGARITAADCKNCTEIVSQGWCPVIRKIMPILKNKQPSREMRIKYQLNTTSGKWEKGY